MQRLSAARVSATFVFILSTAAVFAEQPKDVNVANTPNVNVVSLPAVQLTGTPTVSIMSLPPLTFAPAQTLTTIEAGEPYEVEAAGSAIPGDSVMGVILRLPAHKRLVVETISANAVVAPACHLSTIVMHTEGSRELGGVSWRLPLLATSSTPTENEFTLFALSTRMYAVDDIVFNATRTGSINEPGTLTVTIAGRLFPIP
jgi:hypothetical protein